LAETALANANPETFAIARDLIAAQIATLPAEAVSVREKWREVQTDLFTHNATLQKIHDPAG
jgi:hypothetical protein